MRTDQIVVTLALDERQARSLLRTLEFGEMVFGPVLGTPDIVAAVMSELRGAVAEERIFDEAVAASFNNRARRMAPAALFDAALGEGRR
jgi:hypothetical protein